MNKHLHSGFTLIEMTIVIFIIAIISGISIANFRAGERQKALVLASETITNAIRNAQNFSLSGKKIASSTCTVGGVVTTAPKAYLVNLSNVGTLSLYGIDKCDTANLVETYPYPAKTKIPAEGYKLNGNTSSNAVSALQFKFFPPFGTETVSTDTTLNSGSFVPFTNATVTVASDDSAIAPRTVIIDGLSGRIGD